MFDSARLTAELNTMEVPLDLDDLAPSGPPIMHFLPPDRTAVVGGALRICKEDDDDSMDVDHLSMPVDEDDPLTPAAGPECFDRGFPLCLPSFLPPEKGTKNGEEEIPDTEMDSDMDSDTDSVDAGQRLMDAEAQDIYRTTHPTPIHAFSVVPCLATALLSSERL